MLTDRDYLVQTERYEDMLREADTARLLQPAPQGQAGQVRTFPRLVSLLGHRLVGWLRRLKQRYAPAALSTTTPQPRQSSAQLQLAPQQNVSIPKRVKPSARE